MAVWTPDTTYHPVCCERPLDEARDHVRRVVPVVGDASQAGVDGNHDQQELDEGPQQPRTAPRQPGLQVKLPERERKKSIIGAEPDRSLLVYIFNIP